MRIGIIAPPWIPIPPDAYGGIESFIDTLARALQEAGQDVVLAASDDSTSSVPRLDGFEPSDPETMGVTAHELRHLLRAFAGLKDVDVILDNTLAGPVLSKAETTVPVVTVAHGPLIPLEQELYLNASADVSFVAISHNQASLAGPVPITRVIHHGIRVGDVPIGPGGDAACFVGRMHASKGIPEAINAAEIAGIPLRIAAKMQEPAEEEYFEEVVRPRLGRNAEYLGELTAEEKYELMGNSCALLNPIQWDEPFGLVMIEALATGSPVVATPRGSVQEIVEEGRTGFVRSAPRELAEALSRAADLDRGACRQAAETRFSDTRMAAEYIDLFTELLRERRRLDRPYPDAAAVKGPARRPLLERDASAEPDPLPSS
ncbi:glycosyltransferase involved in cell wall biosynthesis [Agromyces flavus]|uniref:Glycosyltransferase involved in cell wall biosynthesis n=2 Tax=Agromyces flavus TaxID=589382 RepID=A0A1H1LCD2_9MICO|nr:glycosyltransferase [Agromyces flavus]MCP2367511.1 glycosyltransferase involved in cell wall biosynthesis [Agromyces flavus]GGI45586.1 glycosyl transferase [Agromyces flavus]SDR71972.1 Glycosyltransferase involved in cell wall bisynthesis [Agromyces flavus]